MEEERQLEAEKTNTTDGEEEGKHQADEEEVQTKKITSRERTAHQASRTPPHGKGAHGVGTKMDIHQVIYR